MKIVHCRAKQLREHHNWDLPDQENSWRSSSTFDCKPCSGLTNSFTASTFSPVQWTHHFYAWWCSFESQTYYLCCREHNLERNSLRCEWQKKKSRSLVIVTSIYYYYVQLLVRFWWRDSCFIYIEEVTEAPSLHDHSCFNKVSYIWYNNICTSIENTNLLYLGKAGGIALKTFGPISTPQPDSPTRFNRCSTQPSTTDFDKLFPCWPKAKTTSAQWNCLRL
jgi:hypothetical protein